MLVSKSRVWVLAFLVMAVSAGSAYCARARDRFLLRDGFFLRGADGKVEIVDANQGGRRYFFEFKSDVSDGRASVTSGSRVELLPSSALEQMITGLGKEMTGAYRVWGHVTRYRGKNYVFAVLFLPLAVKAPEAEDNESPRHQDSPPADAAEEGDETDSSVNDANDTVKIPANILEKLKGKKIKRPIKSDKPAGGDVVEFKKPKKRFKPDTVTAGRVGIVNSSDQLWRVGWSTEFLFDSLGRSIEDRGFELLPCEVLERTLDRQSYEPEVVRLKISGLVTEFMGRKYLLLQRAVRAYGHGNLGK